MVSEQDIKDMQEWPQPKANDIQHGVVEIPLSKGYVALVDPDTAKIANCFKWSALETGNKVYAVRENSNGKYSYMHRLILGAGPEDIVDHIDGNGLNNTKVNLRIVTKSQNAFNSFIIRGKSKYKGVWYKPNRPNPWVAQTQIDGVKYRLGHYQTEEQAAEAYNNFVLKFVGVYARLNNVSE